MLIKRMMAGLLGLAITQILFTGCEKAPDSVPWLCSHKVNQAVLLAKDGGTALGPGLPFDKVSKLVIIDGVAVQVDFAKKPDTLITVVVVDSLRNITRKDTTIDSVPVITDWVEYKTPIFLSQIGKIVFKP
jgi:hypothetical protein